MKAPSTYHDKTFIGIDFETFGKVDLPTYGLDNYINGEGFQPLIASVSHPAFGNWTYDFVMDEDAEQKFKDQIFYWITVDGKLLSAHNAGFERAVFRFMNMDYVTNFIVDSAVFARMLNVSESLEMSSRQLTNTPKLAVGMDLIKLFSIPNDHFKGEAPTPTRILNGHTETWLQYIDYCEVDAQGSREITEYAIDFYTKMGAEMIVDRECKFELLTDAMNQVGWKVDMRLVNIMARRALVNTEVEKVAFMSESGENLNFNSHPQMRAFLAKRGYPNVKSLDKYHLPAWIAKIEQDIEDLETVRELEPDESKREQLHDELQQKKQALAMLECKQELGGATLGKLKRIQELVSKDGRLRNQYVHCGAGQTFRTASKGVQMQNIAKLLKILDVETIYDWEQIWTNKMLASQIRQVFTATEELDEEIVGDFSAVESRGLAYIAGEEWKLQAYRDGHDVYRVLVTRFEGFEGMKWEDVGDDLRPRGKYSELSCGYQASAKAVKDFMFRLGFVVSLEEAAQNVSDWRRANPAIVNLWQVLDDLIKNVVHTGQRREAKLAHGLTARITPFVLDSMAKHRPGSQSLFIQLIQPDGFPLVNRVVHGAYMLDRSVIIHKAGQRGGNLWSDVNETASQKASTKDKKVVVLNSIFGGKLAGILTQSLCRELFYDSMAVLHESLLHSPSKINGQFHDELNVDWRNQEVEYTLDYTKELMDKAMSTCRLDDFPLVADIKSAYRYIK